MLTAQPAGAAEPSVRFQITDGYCGSNEVYIFAQGHVPLSQYDAQGYINNGAHAWFELWGDDPGFDDYLTSSQ